MPEPYLYIVCGLPFAGKTTLARELESIAGIHRVAIDDINTERGIWDDQTGLSSEEWTKTYQEAYRRIGVLLKQGLSVVDDSANFTKEQRKHLHTLAASYHAQSRVIYVSTPAGVACQRWQANRQSMWRTDVRDSDFAHVLENFEPPTADEYWLRYDGSLSAENWVRLVFLQSGM